MAFNTSSQLVSGSANLTISGGEASLTTNTSLTASAAAATATVTINSGKPSAGQTIVLISTDGTSKTYTAVAGSATVASNQFSVDNNHDDVAFSLETAIEHSSGHNGKILVSRSVNVLALTQATAGADGNSSITTNMSNTAADASFVGGSSGAIVAAATIINTNTLVANADGYTGKVGVGTATPDETLHVAGNLKVDGYLIGGSPLEVSGSFALTGSDGTGMTLTGSGSPAGAIETKVSGTMEVTGSLHVSGSSTFTVDGPSFLYGTTTVGSDADHNMTVTGKVGVGTTSPAGRLHVKSSANSTYPLYIEASDGSNLGGFFQGGSGNGSFYVRDADGNAKVILQGAGESSFLGGGIATAGRVVTDDATEATTTTDGSLQTDGGLSVAKSAVIGDDLDLLSDSAILSIGAGKDATLTHDGTTGLTIAATPISIDSTGALDLNSTTGDINFQDGGTNQLALDLDGTAGEIIMKLMVDSDDFVFKQYDGTEVFRVEDNGDFDIAGGLGSSGVTVSASGAISADARIITDDTTAATSTTDGSIQTDGGLSVALDAVIGDDLILLSDSAVIHFGADKDTTLTHTDGTGLTLNGANKICFNDTSQFIHASSNAILELGATDEIGLTATLVDMDANLDLDGTANISGLVTIQTGIVPDAEDGAYLGTSSLQWSDLFLASGSVVNFNNGDMTLTHSSNTLTAAGGTVATAALTTSTIVASGIIKTDDSTAATSTTDGSLQTDGGLSVVLDAVIGDDLILLSDASVIHFGANSEITLTHEHDTGLILTHTATGDNTPVKLTLKSEEDAIIDGEVIGAIDFKGGDSGGTDAVLVCAGIEAVATDTHASDNNAAKLSFKTGASEAAAEKMALTSTGDLNIVTDGASIFFGASSEIELRHVADDGLILKHVGTGDGKEPSLTFQAGDNDIAADDVLGSIFFQAPDEGAGTDAILVAAGIEAVSEGDFSASNNATKLSFKTGASETATEKVTIDSAGNLNLIASNTELRFYEAANYVGFEAPALSADQIWVLPAADGSDGQQLTTDGNGVLSWAAAGTASGAQTAITTILNANTKIGRDSQNLIDFATTDNKIIFRVNNVNEVELVENALSPVTSDGVALGTTSLMWSDLFVASGGVLNFDNGDVTVTHSSNTLTVAGGTLATAALTTSTIVASGIIKTDDSTNATSTTDGSLQTDGGLSVVLDAVFGDDVALLSDGAILNFGADAEIKLTHVHDTGLLLTDAGGTPTLQFHDANESISSDGGHLIFTSNGVSFDFPSADGSDGQQLTTDGNGVLTWAAAGTASGAQTAITTILNAGVKIGRDSQNLIDFASTDNKIIFRVNNVNEVELVENALSPVTNDGVALGTTSLMWSDLFVASGGVLNFNNGDMTVTHSSNALTVAGGTLATSALTTSTIVASGIIKTDDSTNATSTTDGSLQTDGGLSVVLDAVFGDDIALLSDAAVLNFGANAEIKLTHVHDVGLTLTNTINGTDNRPIVLQLKSEEDAIVADDVVGSIEFAAGDSDGTDGATVAAGIHAIAEDTFSASANATKLVFTTGVSETAASSATAKMTLTSAGLLQIADDFIIKDAGTIGSASDPDAIAIGSDGDVTLTQDLELQHDGATISLGANDEITVTHVHDVGLTITNTINGTDNRPCVLQLKSEEDAIVLDDVIASIEFAAGDSDGTDGATVAAGIHAIAEGTFSASANATSLVFTTGVSETAASSANAKMKLSSGGDLTVFGDTHTFSSANTTDPLLIIKNTTNDAAGARLRFVNDRGAAGEDLDQAGLIEFFADDDNQDNIKFGGIEVLVADASNGAEGGQMILTVATHDGENQPGLVISDGDLEDEVDANLGNGTLSTTTSMGYMKATSGFLVPEAKSLHLETPLLTSADHTATGMTTILAASETIAIGNLVYVSGNGTIGVADADAVAKMPAIGIAVTGGNANAQIVVLLQGTFRDDTFNFTAGNRLFVHTDGTVTATAPSGSSDVAQAIGVALNADVIYFSPDMTLVEIS